MTHMADVTIYHNPRCSTSRTVLGTLQDAGLNPTIIRYLETPPDEATLRRLLTDAGLQPSQAIRKKESLYAELGLAGKSEDELLAAMVEHPILIERPIVVTPKGTRLARPAGAINEIL
ncbi:arsenate reductase (glutaredoxin) [Smaragdicoccus niigatensis]|uniref:arsenate reductase (glutaredoxin) n=1 Tax=Smaragdicoccus niigatensis TaxID=359359 RepID=UPI00039EB984|nr:arsenate reductase (glutaredoxin) [Smaragdicoccus niigatensis]